MSDGGGHADDPPDFSRLPVRAFWKRMHARHYLHIFNAKGVPKPLQSLPRRLEDLKDDPYRSLVGFVRNADGFAKSTAPFAEFQWADFFRTRISGKSLHKRFERCVQQGVRLARSADASALPGIWAANGGQSQIKANLSRVFHMHIPTFSQVQPILGTRDLEKAIAFYVDRLGFALAFRDGSTPTNYVGFRRDRVELHMQFQYEHEMGTIRLRIVVDDPDALYEEYKDKSVFHERTRLADTLWGTREFAIYDLDRNALTFYRHLKKPSQLP